MALIRVGHRRAGRDRAGGGGGRRGLVPRGRASGVAAKPAATPAAPVPKGKRGAFAFAFADSASLRRALHRSYELACSLPSAPPGEFEAELAELGATEAATWARRRIGQDVFRRAQLRYWQGRCPLTGITEPALLRASHIIPWRSARPTPTGSMCTTAYCWRHIGMRRLMLG